jgi:hypothetical protein
MMPLVSPGDPGMSFLMHKMDGDQCTLAAACNAGPYGPVYRDCGCTMPLLPQANVGASALGSCASGMQVSERDRNRVRAWIEQGAKNN